MGALLAAGGETSPDEAAGAKALCGGDLKCLQNHFRLCIAGAFTKFAIFENRIFLKRCATE